MTNCPECGTELKCPCKCCSRTPLPEGARYWTECGDIAGCPVCDFKAHLDWWQDYELDRLTDHSLLLEKEGKIPRKLQDKNGK